MSLKGEQLFILMRRIFTMFKIILLLSSLTIIFLFFTEDSLRLIGGIFLSLIYLTFSTISFFNLKKYTAAAATLALVDEESKLAAEESINYWKNFMNEKEELEKARIRIKDASKNPNN
jgi:hypothetical protein